MSLSTRSQALSIIIGLGPMRYVSAYFSHPSKEIQLKTHTITVNGGDPTPPLTSMNQQKQSIL